MDVRALAEQEFRDVQRVCVFYGAMLLPILVATAWSFHTESSDAAIELWACAALYTAIVAFAIAWRREWRDLLRWPPGLSNRLAVLLIALPLCSVAARIFSARGGKR